ncbi:hypothetical protein [Pseudochryseolinea flava]|uniref:Uncharacterized protein n=1 Tax=Pseudochryseolinea flava TaxID=2059302 RepID=A0A364Y6V0_9BACT|nr:hypothetical protein [Pseudochryseolinea flava]RAW01991.1 hypothetical protein DQQ10_05385 [Pseudochryseolinea flava]
MINFPVYITCYFFPGKSSLNVYRIVRSAVELHPYQLFRSNGISSVEWENLSVYASVEDAVMIVLRDLAGEELADDILHGQATVNPDAILQRINRGERMVSICVSSKYGRSKDNCDVNFIDLIDRK